MSAPLETTGLAAMQSAFAEALLRSDLSVPAAVAGGASLRRDRRFAVYRNNMKASLAAALAARFPVVERLVGGEFFRAMALVFVERRPPDSPVLAEYGAGFAGFVDTFEPAADLPYLADVARLEWARHVAWHAADAEPIAIDRLAAVTVERLDSVSLALHPAVGVVASAFPVASIWTTNALDEETRSIGSDLPGEIALVTRPGLEVFVNVLPAGADVLLGMLAAGGALGEAVAAAEQTRSGFDAATALSVLFRSGAVATLSVGTS